MFQNPMQYPYQPQQTPVYQNEVMPARPAANPIQQQQTMVPNNWNRPYTYQYSGMQQSSPSFPGRTINNPNEIRPNEVPLDGSASLFPMNDWSCIYLKAWGADGNIQTVRFIPEKLEVVAEQQGPSNFDLVMERLDNIEKMIQSQGNRKQYYNNNNQKKEADNNGN